MQLQYSYEYVVTVSTVYTECAVYAVTVYMYLQYIQLHSIVICSDEASSFLSWQPSSIQSTQGFSRNTHLNERRVLKPPGIYKIN